MQPDDQVRRIRLLSRSALVLNRSWMPVHVTPVRRALCLVIRGCARVVCTDSFMTYDFGEWVSLSDPPTDLFVRSPSMRIPIPEVILLRGYDRVPVHEAPFTRRNLFLRDDYTCQYCGRRCSHDLMSIDHVLPRSRGGPTTWENCVLACVTCNARKGNRTPKEVGLRLRRQPRRPHWTPYFNLRNSHQLDSWRRFAPEVRRRVSGRR